MTDTNTARTPWPQRFGVIQSVETKQGRKGPYVVAKIDCVKFVQSAVVFDAKIVAAIVAAGVGAKVWVKGPIDSVKAEDGTSKGGAMKVVYFKDKSAEAANENDATTADEVAPAPVMTSADPQDLRRIKGIGISVAAKLGTAGILTYAQLIASTDEDLDAVQKGLAKKAASGDYRGQAAALDAEPAAEPVAA